MGKKVELNIHQAWLDFEKRGGSSKKMRAVLSRYFKLIDAEGFDLYKRILEHMSLNKLSPRGIYGLLAATSQFRGRGEDGFSDFCVSYIRDAMLDWLLWKVGRESHENVWDWMSYDIQAFPLSSGPNRKSNRHLDQLLDKFAMPDAPPKKSSGRKRTPQSASRKKNRRSAPARQR